MENNTVKIAVTGPRFVVDAIKLNIIGDAIKALVPDRYLITGACIGVDAYVARVGYQLKHHVHTVVPYPREQIDPEWRRFCTTFEDMPTGSTLLHRNDRLIELADVLYAFPETLDEVHRSGTWSTIRRARQNGRAIYFFALNGEQAHEKAKRRKP